MKRADTGLLSPELAAGIRRVKGAKRIGVRTGNWLGAEQVKALLSLPDVDTVKGKRDRAILAIVAGCGLRHSEAARLEVTTEGRLLRCVSRSGSVWGDGITEKVIWSVVKEVARRAQIGNLAPRDLRRTCARLCHLAGGELEQIEFLLGHLSVQTTEKYPGWKQRLSIAVNDHIGIEPEGAG